MPSLLWLRSKAPLWTIFSLHIFCSCKLLASPLVDMWNRWTRSTSIATQLIGLHIQTHCTSGSHNMILDEGSSRSMFFTILLYNGPTTKKVSCVFEGQLLLSATFVIRNLKLETWKIDYYQKSCSGHKCTSRPLLPFEFGNTCSNHPKITQCASYGCSSFSLIDTFRKRWYKVIRKKKVGVW
jgi:hypothetical protein